MDAEHEHRVAMVKHYWFFDTPIAGYAVVSHTGMSCITRGEQDSRIVNRRPARDAIQPHLCLTLNFSEAEHGTLVRISAAVEHTALVKHVAQSPVWIIPHTISRCEIVHERPIFMHTEKLLNGLLDNIRLEAMPSRRETMSHPVSAGH
jgi:hypothetical protein